MLMSMECNLITRSSTINIVHFLADILLSKCQIIDNKMAKAKYITKPNEMKTHL